MSSSAPELAVRTATEDDAGAIAAVCNAIGRELYGTPDESEATVRSWFRLSDVAMFVVERNRGIAGYADVTREGDGTRFPIDVRVEPGSRGSGAGALLVQAAEAWAREHSGPGALARGVVPERDAHTAGLFARAGYRLIRYSFRMEVALPGPAPAAPWPPGIEVRSYDPECDEPQVYECCQEAFADHWDFEPQSPEVWRERMIGAATVFDPSLWWLAEDGADLAGVCLNFWHYSGDPQHGWIGTLAVRRPWRRRGLGLALLQHSFADFARRGATRVGLGVDAENTTGAVRLYERAGMRRVRRMDTYEKAL